MITFRSRIIHHRRRRPTGRAPSCGVAAALLDHAPSGNRTGGEYALLWLLSRPRTPSSVHGVPSLRGTRSAAANLTQRRRLRSDPTTVTTQRTYHCAAPSAVQGSMRSLRQLPSDPTLRPVPRARMLRQEADAASRRHHLGGVRALCRGAQADCLDR